MWFRLAADLLVLAHLAFILFVCLGGLLAIRRPRWAWLHVPAAAWGVLVEFSGWVCPLTPLEGWLRGLAGEIGYRGGFVEHYLIPLIYPPGLTASAQWALGGFVAAVNAMLYAIAWRRWRRRSGGVAPRDRARLIRKAWTGG
jgi:hypothetical protein